jgi:hypothetical protein
MNALDTLPTRAAIDALQQAMVGMEQAELPTLHHFAGGMYCREMHVPADTMIVGKVHKSEHFFMLLAGEMTLICDGFRQRVAAPFISVSQPGMKRAGYAHSECVCANVHCVGDVRDMEAVEALLVEQDPTARFDAYNHVKPLELDWECEQ